MIGYFFYFIYCLQFLFLITLSYKKGRYLHYSILPLLFFPHFNVTCFFKVGLTISFFELYLILYFLLIIGKMDKKCFCLKMDTSAKIFIAFLAVSLISIFIANIRILFENLVPSTNYSFTPIVRSFMSLNRFFIYIPLLFFIKRFLINKKIDIAFYFKKYLSYSGLLPTIAVIIQYFSDTFLLLFNNPSFSENRGWDVVGRPCGLTNEASFYTIMIFFSFMGVYYAKKDNIINGRISLSLYILYAVGVILSLSRTGMLVFLLFVILKNYKSLNMKKILLFVFVFLLLSVVTVSGFNIVDRFSSSFNVNADLSTIERFGSGEGILNLAFDKSLLFGVGIYNYFYYLIPYLPDYYVNSIEYSNNMPLASFNFIFQLFAEWGGILFVSFLLFSLYKLSKRKCPLLIKDWFLYIFVFSLSLQFLNFSLPFVILLFTNNRDLSKALTVRRNIYNNSIISR